MVSIFPKTRGIKRSTSIFPGTRVITSRG
ncbi:hypothetical protein LINGRAHAP2_LOCUS35760 [Linum grandiflorum]